MKNKKKKQEYIFMWSGVPTLASYLGTPYALIYNLYAKRRLREKKE